MKRQFLFIVAMIVMVFMACEEEKENVNNVSSMKYNSLKIW